VEADLLNNITPGVAIITGAGGQDGYFLTERLLSEGWIVHALARRAEALRFEGLSAEANSRLRIHQIDLLERRPVFDLINSTQPDEFYNLAGQSSVSKSFSDPLYTWQTNAEAVVHLLECIRNNSPHTRFYQASSTDMFGASSAAGVMPYNEQSALNPQSPYASAKAAAHLLCHSYREVYGLRIASGILSNHESHRRPASFLTRKVVEHVRRLEGGANNEPTTTLAMGNLKVQRDWGFAPEYVEGMCRILRQIAIRANRPGVVVQSDEGANYRDYLLATGKTHAVWELVDCAFKIKGFDLAWDLGGDDPSGWSAKFRKTETDAVVVDPDLLRAAEPLVIELDPGRAERELGWKPKQGLEVFLQDMFNKRLPFQGYHRSGGASR
jgi:GDPmannose 4,6-dehydratase